MKQKDKDSEQKKEINKCNKEVGNEIEEFQENIIEKLILYIKILIDTICVILFKIAVAMPYVPNYGGVDLSCLGEKSLKSHFLGAEIYSITVDIMPMLVFINIILLILIRKCKKRIKNILLIISIIELFILFFIIER